MEQPKNQNNDKLQASVTSRRVSEPRPYSIADPPTPEIAAAFEKLTEWQRELGRCLQSSRSQRDLKPYSDTELLVRIHDWSGPLWVVPLWGLRFCFNKAIAIRVQGTFTFEAGEVVDVWHHVTQAERDRLFSVFSEGRVLSGPACDWCNGSGFVYVNRAGHQVKWEQRQEGEAMKRCAHTDVAGQMEL